MKQSLYLAGPKTPSRLTTENLRPKGLEKENKEKVVAKRKHTLPPSSRKSTP